MNLHPVTRVDTVHLFPEVLDGLLELLEALDGPDWLLPTVCPGWSVHDVAVHLLGVEVGNLSARRDNWRFGPERSEDLLPWLNSWNETWVDAGRRLSPPVLIDLMALIGRQMCDCVAELDLDELGGPVTWAGPDPAPVWLDVAREFTERWLHQQHIRDAVGQPGLKQARYVAPVLGTFVHAVPHALRDVRRAPGTVVAVKLVGEGAGDWSIVAEPDGWRLLSGAVDDAATRVTLDTDVAWRLWTKGLEPSDFEHVIAGDPELGRRALRAVAIIA